MVRFRKDSSHRRLHVEARHQVDAAEDVQVVSASEFERGQRAERNEETRNRSEALPRTRCQEAICEVLQAKGRRLTTKEMLSALSSSGKIHGESTVKTSLAELVRRGVLTTCSHCRPPGYGLPTWGHTNH